MFNNPRPAQRYGGSIGPSNSFGTGSYVDDNGPLTTSVYDGLDPWSSGPSPSHSPVPSGLSSVFSSIGEATVPPIYTKALNAVDPTGTGDVSVNALSRVISTSSLPAATVDRIVNLVSSKPRVSKLEFFVAMALVALAQAGSDISIEQVAVLAAQNELPEPSLDLSAVPPSFSDFATARQDVFPPPLPAYSSEDPWNTATRTPPAHRPLNGDITGGILGEPATSNGMSSSVSGTGLPPKWWMNLESVTVNIKGQQGFILNRYMVYDVTTIRGANLPRRYSEFAILWETLVRRYPFRLIPALPPKRIQPDEHFLEQRRRGLTRFLTFVVNHPILREDGVLGAFLSEPSFEDWRRRTSISAEEESASKRVDKAEEMSIPSDLEEKLAHVRGKVNTLIDHWQKICIFAERMAKRRESAAADTARLTNTLKALVETNVTCWRGDTCELCAGVNNGVSTTANHCQRHADLLEQRTRSVLYITLEALKSQRDLYMALRELFIRHDKQSGDQVDRLRKKIETTSSKLEGVRAGQKDGWQVEADRLVSSIEKDQAQIAAQLHRRVFIRACLWHELRVVLHNRENTLVTEAVRSFAREESQFAELVAQNWAAFSTAVGDMPYE